MYELITYLTSFSNVMSKIKPRIHVTTSDKAIVKNEGTSRYH
ncbi:hypothetical protein JMUB7504_27070 [Staphylococcus aureus]